MDEPSEGERLKAAFAATLTELESLTVLALRSRFRAVMTAGIDWRRAAREVHRRLTWPWTPEEWDEEVDRVGYEIDRSEGDEWLTADFVARRDSGGSC